jgi:hypothetical protein
MLEAIEDRLARLVTAQPQAGPASTLDPRALIRGSGERLLLLHQWLSVAATREPSMLNAPSTVLWVIEQAMDSAAAHAASARKPPLELIIAAQPRLSLEADPSALVQRVPGLVGVDLPARSAAVSLRTTNAASDDRGLALLDWPLFRADCVRLSDRAFQGPGNCTTLDGSHALVTRVDSTMTHWIDDEGHVAPAYEWPRPIWGALPAASGTVFAWHNPDRVLLYRRDSRTKPEVIGVPFRPVRGVVAADGSSIWCAFEGGLWRWRPDFPVEFLVETPTPIHLHALGEAVRVDLATRRVDGTPVRRRLTSSLLWQPGARSLSAVAIGKDGQCTAEEHHGAWTARAHPYSDVVTLAGPDGRRARLAVHYPLTVAWAGSSLLVCTGDFQVLLFRGLETRLEEAFR